MFGIWHKIKGEGEASIPAEPSALSALEWCEIGEKNSNLVPEPFRGFDPVASPRLIRKSPCDCREADAYDFSRNVGLGIDSCRGGMRGRSVAQIRVLQY